MKQISTKEYVAEGIFFLFACLSVAAVVLLCGFIVTNGFSAMRDIGLRDFLLGEKWRPSDEKFGILPMITGSLLVTAGGLLVGGAAGLLTAIYMAELCPKSIYRILKPVIELMAGVPSVVYGFWGLNVIVPLVREKFGGRGMSLLSASVVLGIMIMPTVINMAESAIKAVPGSYHESAVALGASSEYSRFFAVLPVAQKGVAAGVILGAGRALGETVAVMMVAGNQPLLPTKLTDGVRTLTANIALEMGYATGRHKGALIAAAVVLFVLVALLNTGVAKIMERKTI